MGRYINRTRTPKRHILAWKDVIWRIDCQNRSTGLTCVLAHETKKRQWKKHCGTVEKWVFTQTTHVVRSNTIWHVGWSSGSSYKFQVSSTRLSGYRAVMGRNVADPFTLPNGLLNSRTPIRPWSGLPSKTVTWDFALDVAKYLKSSPKPHNSSKWRSR